MRSAGLPTLLRASFEETVDVFADAAVFAESDGCNSGVTQSIMLGQQAPIGSASFGILVDKAKVEREENKKKKKEKSTITTSSEGSSSASVFVGRRRKKEEEGQVSEPATNLPRWKQAEIRRSRRVRKWNFLRDPRQGIHDAPASIDADPYMPSGDFDQPYMPSGDFDQPYMPTGDFDMPPPGSPPVQIDPPSSPVDDALYMPSSMDYGNFGFDRTSPSSTPLPEARKRKHRPGNPPSFTTTEGLRPSIPSRASSARFRTSIAFSIRSLSRSRSAFCHCLAHTERSWC